jgi:hypothetical protein
MLLSALTAAIGCNAHIVAPAENGVPDVVDGCAGRPAKGRRCKSVTVKA